MLAATTVAGMARVAVAFVGPGIIVAASGRTGDAAATAGPLCAGGAEVLTGPAAEALPGGWFAAAAVGVVANDLEIAGEIQSPLGAAALVRAELAPIAGFVAVGGWEAAR